MTIPMRKYACILLSLPIAAAALDACSDESGSSDGGPDATTDVVADTFHPDANVVDGASDASDAATDGPMEAAPACDLTKPFAAPVEVTSLDTGTSSQMVRLSSDELRAYFQLDNKLAFASRASVGAAFGAPSPLDFTTDGGVDAGALLNSAPTPSPDELTLYWGSTQITYGVRATTTADFDERGVVPGLADSSNTGQPFLQGDGSAIYFVSRSTTTDAGVAQGLDIYRVPVTAPGVVGPWERLTELDGARDEGYPAVTADGLTIFFNRTELGDGGSTSVQELWTASRTSTSQPFANVSPVAELNDDVHNMRPSWVTPDGCTLWFSSNRDTDASSSYRMYTATRGP